MIMMQTADKINMLIHTAPTIFPMKLARVIYYSVIREPGEPTHDS